jgi:hypothetical protein
MADANNFNRGRAARELVAVTLRHGGFPEARHRVPPRRLSDRLAMPDEERSDILGIEGWHLTVAADVSPRWGTRLDSTQAIANLGGFENFALIEYRAASDVGDWFALMNFNQLVRLMKQATRPEVAA